MHACTVRYRSILLLQLASHISHSLPVQHALAKALSAKGVGYRLYCKAFLALAVVLIAWQTSPFAQVFAYNNIMRRGVPSPRPAGERGGGGHSVCSLQDIAKDNSCWRAGIPSDT